MNYRYVYTYVYIQIHKHTDMYTYICIVWVLVYTDWTTTLDNCTCKPILLIENFYVDFNKNNFN